jgi:hypothetical protein
MTDAFGSNPFGGRTGLRMEGNGAVFRFAPSTLAARFAPFETSVPPEL